MPQTSTVAITAVGAERSLTARPRTDGTGGGVASGPTPDLRQVTVDGAAAVRADADGGGGDGDPRDTETSVTIERLAGDLVVHDVAIPHVDVTASLERVIVERTEYLSRLVTSDPRRAHALDPAEQRSALRLAVLGLTGTDDRLVDPSSDRPPVDSPAAVGRMVYEAPSPYDPGTFADVTG